MNGTASLSPINKSLPTTVSYSSSPQNKNQIKHQYDQVSIGPAGKAEALQQQIQDAIKNQKETIIGEPVITHRELVQVETVIPSLPTDWQEKWTDDSHWQLHECFKELSEGAWQPTQTWLKGMHESLLNSRSGTNRPEPDQCVQGLLKTMRRTAGLLDRDFPLSAKQQRKLTDMVEDYVVSSRNAEHKTARE